MIDVVTVVTDDTHQTMVFLQMMVYDAAQIRAEESRCAAVVTCNTAGVIAERSDFSPVSTKSPSLNDDH